MIFPQDIKIIIFQEAYRLRTSFCIFPASL
jgi:hypothetical protein